MLFSVTYRWPRSGSPRSPSRLFSAWAFESPINWPLLWVDQLTCHWPRDIPSRLPVQLLRNCKQIWTALIRCLECFRTLNSKNGKTAFPYTSNSNYQQCLFIFCNYFSFYIQYWLCRFKRVKTIKCSCLFSITREVTFQLKCSSPCIR